MLKKQHRQALLLDNFYGGVDGLAPGRSLRDRKPVTYTFGKSKKFKPFRCPHIPNIVNLVLVHFLFININECGMGCVHIFVFL